MPNRNAHEDAAKYCPETASCHEGDQNVADDAEVLVHKDAKVLKQDRDLHAKEARVIDPDRDPEPVEAIRLHLGIDVPVMQSHAKFN